MPTKNLIQYPLKIMKRLKGLCSKSILIISPVANLTARPGEGIRPYTDGFIISAN